MAERRRLPHRFWRTLAAVVLGNAVYFALLSHLPAGARHEPYAIDWGLAVDFWFCLAAYGALGVFPWRR